jgi:mono/diheme cytochrome c family protein
MRQLMAGVAFLGMLASAAPVSAQDQARVERGIKVFADSRCSMCHSVAGKGNSKGVLDGIASKLSAGEIREWIVNPQKMSEQAKSTRKPPMKPFASMPKDDLDALVAYLMTLKGK